MDFTDVYVSNLPNSLHLHKFILVHDNLCHLAPGPAPASKWRLYFSSFPYNSLYSGVNDLPNM